MSTPSSGSVSALAPLGRTPQLAAHYAYCEAQLRQFDRDRWLACLFAPSAFRPRLHALYAFNLEIARVRELVSDPMPGEIRMQWWVDAIEGEARGDVRSHPVAAALIDTIRCAGLPRRAFTDLIEARRFDLYDEPMADMEAFETYCGSTASALFRLATIVLADGAEPGGAEVAGFAGVAYAATGLLRAFPWHAARGQIYIPADVLERHGLTPPAALTPPATLALQAALREMQGLALRRYGQAREGLSSLAPIARPAFVALATAPLYLKTMDRRDYQPFLTDVQVAQWRRQWAMWRFA